MATPETPHTLTAEQQELIDAITAVWLAMPGLRLGQALVYALGTGSVDRQAAVIPIVQDETLLRGLRNLHRQFTANRPPTPPTEPGA